MSRRDHAHEGHSHDHGASLARAGSRHRGRLMVVFAMTLTFLVVEAVAAFVTGSLALLSDAGHMLTDVAGLGMALAAISLADRFERRRGAATAHTFGLYRLEVLAAFVNSLLLIGVAVYVLIEAIRRLGDEPEVQSVPMFVVAVFGLVVNLIGFVLLRAGSKESLNVEGAALEVLADAVGSVGVIIAAVGTWWLGWWWLDPVIAVAIGVWIVPRAWRLGRQAVRVLLQAAPEGIDLDELRADLVALPGVVDVHDVHVWTLTSEMDVGSAHLRIADTADAHGVLDAARTLLSADYAIAHATLQVEPESHEGCDELTW